MTTIERIPIRLYKDPELGPPDRPWRADMILPSGLDIHAIGKEPWNALEELLKFWRQLRAREDLRKEEENGN